MLQTRRQKRTPPKMQRKSYKSWLKGYISQLGEDRTPEDGLVVASNVVLSQNGTVRPAPSSVLYGLQPTGTVLGQVFPFTRLISGKIENWECFLMNVGGTVSLYVRKDGGALTICTGKTFPATASGRFAQIKNVVLVASGTDYFCWMDTTTLAVITQIALPSPTAPTLTPTSLTGTVTTLYYRATALNVGESAAGASTAVQVSLQRDQWNPNTQWVDVSIPRITGAAAYSFYMGSASGEEVLLATVPDPGTGTTVSYRDNGSAIPTIDQVAPAFDSSLLPKVSYVRVLNDQIFIWGDKDDQWKIWYGGVYKDILKFSAWYGGGYVRVANGTPYIPNNVSMFRTGKGDPVITVLCRGMAGTGKRFVLNPVSATEGDVNLSGFVPQEDNGAYGTDSPDGVVMAEDDIFYPSKDSFKKTGNKVNVPNILSSKGITDVIERDVEALNSLAMSKCVGLYYKGRIYWAVPYGGASSNNQIWTLDITRGGAWMLPIDVAADWMWLYEDSSGITHFCYLSNNKIYEFTYSRATDRDGTPFSTTIGMPIIKFSDDGEEWWYVEKIKFVLSDPQGNISGSLVAKTEDSSVSPVGFNSYITQKSVTGFGEDAVGMYAIGEVREVPTAYGNQREPLVIEVDEDVNYLQPTLSSVGAGADYELTDFIVYGMPIGTKDED